MENTIGRRSFLQGITAASAAGTLAAGAAAPGEGGKYQGGASLWPLTLNTSTIRPAPLLDKIRIAAQTGWDGIELWIDDLEKHEQDGGSLKDLGQSIRDQGLFVPNIIGLWNCMPAEPEAWAPALGKTRERMRMSADVGSRCAAAIPMPDRADFDLKWGADRYSELMRIGRDDYGITIAFEFVGFFKGVHRLGQACAVALDANDPTACLIMDTFHLHRGGSGFHGIRHLDGDFIAIFHWNDVPDGMTREAMGDKDRLFPGDGVLPLGQALRDLKEIGYAGPLSLEIFKEDYWQQDLTEVARAGLDKMRACVQAAGVA
jgi:sugar phosphate isomerase/epimerase